MAVVATDTAWVDAARNDEKQVLQGKPRSRFVHGNAEPG